LCGQRSGQLPRTGGQLVNAIFRIGDRFAARFPLVAGEYGPVRTQLEAEAAVITAVRAIDPHRPADGQDGAAHAEPHR
jgi:hypothetical protein